MMKFLLIQVQTPFKSDWLDQSHTARQSDDVVDIAAFVGVLEGIVDAVFAATIDGPSSATSHEGT